MLHCNAIIYMKIINCNCIYIVPTNKLCKKTFAILI